LNGHFTYFDVKKTVFFTKIQGFESKSTLSDEKLRIFNKKAYFFRKVGRDAEKIIHPSDAAYPVLQQKGILAELKAVPDIYL
jgi:hypothetical protein